MNVRTDNPDVWYHWHAGCSLTGVVPVNVLVGAFVK